MKGNFEVTTHSQTIAITISIQFFNITSNGENNQGYPTDMHNTGYGSP
jgi:hypothetical protein